MATIDELLREFRGAASGASAESLERVADQLGVVFPSDYVTFMQVSNGGEGSVDKGHVRLWPGEELVESNEGYRAREFYPRYALLGSNGGGEAIAIRKGTHEIVLLPFIGNEDDALVGGTTLVEFLTAYGSGSIWKRQP